MPGAANVGCARAKACHPHGFACGVPPTTIEGAKATTIQSAANRGASRRSWRIATRGLPDSSPDGIRSADLLSPLLIPRLLLPSLIAHDALIRSIAPARVRSRCRSWLRLLAAMLAALILHAFQIVFSGHRDQTLFSQHFPGQQARTSRGFLMPDNSLHSRRVPPRDAASARNPPIAWNPNPRRKF